MGKIRGLHSALGKLDETVAQGLMEAEVCHFHFEKIAFTPVSTANQRISQPARKTAFRIDNFQTGFRSCQLPHQPVEIMAVRGLEQQNLKIGLPGIHRISQRPAWIRQECLKPGQQLLCRHWASNHIALQNVATQCNQHQNMLYRLTTFGHDFSLKCAGQADHRLNDVQISGIAQHVTDKGLVNFQDVDGQMLQMRQRRIARAKIVQRKTQAAGTMLFDQRRNQANIFKRCRF